MRLIVFVSMLLISNNVIGQVTVNGVTPGDLWRTDNVNGEVEVMHALGRTVMMPVKDAWVQIVGDEITIGARCDDPVLDGKLRKDYRMSRISGKIDKTFMGEYVHAITTTSCYQPAENAEIKVTNTAMISIKDGKPQALIFTQLEYAAFDITAFVALLRKSGGSLAEREIEDLAGFDSLNFRQRTFRAVFK